MDRPCSRLAVRAAPTVLAAASTGCADEAPLEFRELGPAPYGFPLPGAPIEVPSDHFTPPPKLAVLPVIVIPSDQQSAVGDLALASNNFGVSLQIARRKYETMLHRDKHDRGTFTLASWNEAAGIATTVGSSTQAVEPMVVEIDETAAEVAGQYFSEDYSFAGAVLDAAGCVQATCPFVFAISVVGDPFFQGSVNREGGRKMNHGLNNAGGVAFFNYEAGPLGISEATTNVTFQSTLLHELGHAFGLPHIFAYCGGSCPDTHAASESPSIMSYNIDNQIRGCGYPNRSSAPCAYPGDAVVDALPGTLIAEDIRVLDHNDRGFPQLDWVIALDGDVTYRGTAVENTDLGDHTTVDMTTPHQGDGSPPTVLIGDKGQSMLEFFEGENNLRMWRSEWVGNNGWATVHVSLPDTLKLHRVDVYSGYASGSAMMTGARLRRGRTTVDERLFTGPVGNSHLSSPAGTLGSSFDIDVRAGGTGLVVVRAIRLFGEVDGEIVEVYPSVEPTIVAKTTGTYDGALDAIVGSRQRVRAYGESFDPNSSWHSTQVTPGAWMSVDVEFAEPVALGAVKAHTGHSGQYHAARGVQIERECACTVGLNGQDDACGMAAGVACSFGDGMVFEFVATAGAGPDTLVWFPERTARRWRIASFPSWPLGQISSTKGRNLSQCRKY
ncbi:MAG: hypothetical protein AAF721_42420 [Myxococcota bacterium]